jgi:hypothetical protein
MAARCDRSINLNVIGLEETVLRRPRDYPRETRFSVDQLRRPQVVAIGIEQVEGAKRHRVGTFIRQFCL